MEEKFSIPFENHQLIGDTLSIGPEKPNTLVLHGAGKANRRRYRVIREFLLQHGIGSCAFDMIGHGDTGGDLANSNLAQRTQQALSVIKERQLREPLTLIGASMGAYTSVKIAESHNIDSLILLVPGMYAQSAYHLSFGEEFSKEIRKTHNWQGSDAWDILSRYKGKILIIAAEEDRTVPRELTQKIFDSAGNSSGKELYFVPGAPHLLMQYLSEQPEQLRVVLGKILRFAA